MSDRSIEKPPAAAVSRKEKPQQCQFLCVNWKGLGLVGLSVVVVACAVVYWDRGSKPEGIVALTPEINHIGERYTSEDDSDKHGFIYYGVRYATAGRFEDAELNWDYSYMQDVSRLKQGHICPQHPLPMPGLPPRNISMDEDCLYLDIYVPSVKGQTRQPLPVLLWIHGGAFISGDKDIYNASHLASAIDVIVVTINYRLFAFGFLSTGDEAAKGNYALSDMKIALEWTKQNIDKYGGDGKKISIFGESAGGAAVSALMLDSKVRGSVRAAVAMSGSIMGHWANHTNPRSSVVALATSTGCQSDTSSAEMVKCLKGLTSEHLLDASRKETSPLELDMQFTPVVDNHHILPFQTAHSKRPDSGQEGNFITGYLKEDSSLLLWLTSPHLFNPSTAISYADSVKFATRQLIPFVPCVLQNPAILLKILEKYGFAETDDRTALLQKQIKLLTDITFAYPSVKEAMLYARRNHSADSPNYLYRISYDSNYYGLGAFHAMDVMHVFGGAWRNFINMTFSEETTRSLRELLRQAAYDGRIAGEPVGADLVYTDLVQSGKFQKGVDDLKDLVDFWDEIRDLPCVSRDHAESADVLFEL